MHVSRCICMCASICIFACICMHPCVSLYVCFNVCNFPKRAEEDIRSFISGVTLQAAVRYLTHIIGTCRTQVPCSTLQHWEDLSLGLYKEESTPPFSLCYPHQIAARETHDFWLHTFAWLMSFHQSLESIKKKFLIPRRSNLA